MPQDNGVIIENVRLIFRNFRGAETEYNDKGNRNFGVLLPPDVADDLAKDGWNVKATKERELDEGEMTGGEPWLPVKVGFDGRPPTIVMINSRGRQNLDESLVELLDFADITHCDVKVRPYDWSVGGKSGRKAYLQSIYATVNEDALEEKYADVPSATTRVHHDE